MNSNQYEKMMNSIIKYAPIESGIQTLVYMFLYEIFENVDFDILIIDRMQKKSQYNTYSGIPDIAIINNNSDKIVFCVETKAISEKLSDHEEQFLGHLLTYRKTIATNGKQWICYDIDYYIKNNKSNEIEECWINTEIESIQSIVLETIEKDRLLAKHKSSLAHINEENRVLRTELEKAINQLQEEIKNKSEQIDRFINENQIIKGAIDNPRFNITISERNKESEQIISDKFISLICELYEFVKEI